MVLAMELARTGLTVARQAPIRVEYGGVVLGEGFRADLLVEDKLVIEIKSVELLSPLHAKQLLTYLRLLDQPLGLLMNFGGETFREGIKRVVNNHGGASTRLRVNQTPAIRIESPPLDHPSFASFAIFAPSREITPTSFLHTEITTLPNRLGVAW